MTELDTQYAAMIRDTQAVLNTNRPHPVFAKEQIR